MVELGFKFIHPDAKLPTYATDVASGMDLYSVESAVLFPLSRKLIHTGICPVIPKGYELQVRPRSGLALKHGITVLNAPGTIDQDYTGEIMVILYNSMPEQQYAVVAGDKIAQLVLAEVSFANIKQVQELPVTQRNANGFGSTGT